MCFDWQGGDSGGGGGWRGEGSDGVSVGMAFSDTQIPFS